MLLKENTEIYIEKGSCMGNQKFDIVNKPTIMKQRKVFFLGAGAATDWDGPSTCYLTKVIRNSGFKNSRGEFVTDVIFQQLCIKRDKCCKSVNFETIINAVEDFFQFWATSDKEQVNGLDYLIDKNDPKWRDLINYASGEGNAIHIEGAGQSLLGHELNTDSELEPNAKYFGLLLIKLLSDIVFAISEYSHFTQGNEITLNCDKNEDINRTTIDYLKQEAGSNFLRFYSLNYDKVIQYLFQKAELKVFQGFNTDEIVPAPNEYIRFDPIGILEQRNCHCVYHLHGNFCWHVNAYDENQLPGYTIYLTDSEQALVNEEVHPIKIEKGRTIFVSNIITGYQKTQRSSLSPFRQMAASFDMDCLTADELVIVGYSFGDEHVNDIIRQARKYNNKVEIIIVGPNSVVDSDYYFQELMSGWDKLSEFPFEHVSDKELYSKAYKVRLVSKDFKSFLKQALGQPND